MLAGRLAPDDRRAIIAQMKGTLVQARIGLDDLRESLASTRARVENERRELETVRRRKGLAEKVGDAETVGVAGRYEAQVAERVRVFEQKLAAQEAELTLAESEVEEMTTEFKAVAAGHGLPETTAGEAAAREADDAMDGGGARLRGDLDAMGRAHMRARREAEADERLAELKRRMGK